MAYTFQQLAAYAQQAGFPADQAATAAAIALAESSGNPDASHVNNNRSTDYGLWQINSIHGSLLAGKNWRDPVTNAQMAFRVWSDAGRKWTPWSTFNSGSYRQYMNGTVLASGSAGASSAGTGTDPLSGVSAAIDGIGAPFAKLAGSLTVFDKLTMPQFWVRVMAGLFGAGLVGFGVVILTREVRN